MVYDLGAEVLKGDIIHKNQRMKKKNQTLSAFSAPVPQDMATQDFALIPREYFRFLENFLKLRT